MKNYYSSEALQSIAKDRGFTMKTLGMELSSVLNKKPETITTKLETGRLTRAEALVVASLLRMRPIEYAEVFLHDLFVENSIGELVAYVERPTELLHPKKEADVDDYLRDSRFSQGLYKHAKTGGGD